MTAHTPEPWQVIEGRDVTTDVWRIEGSDGNVVFDCSFEDYEGGGSPPAGEDLSLILASPDLLSACVSVFEWFDMHGGALSTFEGGADLEAKVLAAISKAKGEKVLEDETA